MRMRETQLFYGLMFIFFFLVAYLLIAKCVDNRKLITNHSTKKKDVVKTDTVKPKDWSEETLSPEKKSYYEHIYSRTHDY